MFNQGIKCQNYLAVGYYIESNKINLNTFITQWVIHHISFCINKSCPICSELENPVNLINKEEEKKNDENKNLMTNRDNKINKKVYGNQNKLDEDNVVFNDISSICRKPKIGGLLELMLEKLIVLFLNFSYSFNFFNFILFINFCANLNL